MIYEQLNCVVVNTNHTYVVKQDKATERTVSSLWYLYKEVVPRCGDEQSHILACCLLKHQANMLLKVLFDIILEVVLSLVFR